MSTKKTVFTICAKNYLAQALTLRESVFKYNTDVDFYLFLSDLKEGDDIPSFVEELNENWIPEWKTMAFKYNVIEFSTSIKPFCINKLFKQGYEKVIYLDPDIYVTNDLRPIFEMLDKKTIVLSPHYCEIQTNYTGSVTEEELLWVGIYNLGFCAIANNGVGQRIADWWCNRLLNKCYADHKDGLHVDQKWMDFVPAFFPNDVLITHHMGINPAIWNLHERELEIANDGTYIIKNVVSKMEFPLLFFHFSGFDPFNTEILNRRHPKYGVKQFPSFKPLIDEYVEAEYRNGYDKYSKLTYSFNSFENGENIMSIHRRLYRALESTVNDINPFSTDSKIYMLLRKSSMLSGINSRAFRTFTPQERQNKGRLIKMIYFCMRMLKSIVGVRYYTSLITNLKDIIRLENQIFLLKK